MLYNSFENRVGVLILLQIKRLKKFLGLLSIMLPIVVAVQHVAEVQAQSSPAGLSQKGLKLTVEMDQVKDLSPGVDQAIVADASVAGDMRYFLIKRFLDARKAAAVTGTHVFAEYYLMDQKGIKHFIAKFDGDAKAESLAYRNGALYVSIDTGLKDRSTYAFNLSSLKAKRVDAGSVDAETRFGLDKDHFLTLGNKNEGSFEIHSMKDKSKKVSSIFPGNTLSVFDVRSYGNEYVVYGQGSDGAKYGVAFLWQAKVLLSTGNQAHKVTLGKVHRFDEEGLVDTTIMSGEGEPAFFATLNPKGFKPVKYFLFDHQFKPVWQEVAGEIPAPKIASGKVCSNHFVILRHEKSDNVTNSVRLTLLNASGASIETKVVRLVTHGTLSGLGSLVTEPDELLFWVNFDELEQTRRKDGWYNWSGYSISKIEVDC